MHMLVTERQLALRSWRRSEKQAAAEKEAKAERLRQMQERLDAWKAQQ